MDPAVIAVLVIMSSLVALLIGAVVYKQVFDTQDYASSQDEPEEEEDAGAGAGGGGGAGPGTAAP